VRRHTITLDAWVGLLTCVLCAPLLMHTGYPLARDLVFTPRQPLTLETLGLGSLPARAVPLDGVVWLLERLADGAVLARVLVPGALLVAGCGAHRLARELPFAPRLLVAGLAVWNPYVVERLALGQWAALWCYAALWWLVAVARRGSSLPVIGWLAVASVTPTGGVIATGTAVVVSRSWRVALAGALLQLPWLLPSILSTAAVSSDPAGVAAFAARSERPGGVLLSLVGMGGIWDAGSTPATRTGVLGYVTTALVVLALVLGGRKLPRPLVVVGAAGLVLAVASSVPGLDELVQSIVETVPGAGLLRDAQKWLMPYVLVVVLSAGELAAGAASRVRGSALAVPAATLAAVLPLLLLPDGAEATWKTVTPVHYPTDFAAVTEAVGRGDVAVLPWRSYRRFSWGRPVSTYDPASRWLDSTVVTDDSLVVGDIALAGESDRARAIGRALDRGRPADVLGDQGISWVLVYRDDPAYGDLDLDGLTPVYAGEQLELRRVPGKVTEPPLVPPWKRWLVAGVDLSVLAGLVLCGRGAAARTRRTVRK